MRLHFLALLPLAACAWISDAELAAREDADGDGIISKAFGGADCDDSRDDVHPGAEEACDRRDNDCDGQTDEDAGTTWFVDHDADDYGDDATGLRSCSAPAGYTDQPGDCDDANAAVHPGAAETCNGVDDDCDPSTVDTLTFYYTDADGDGWGDPSTGVAACAAPPASVDNDEDCDDTDDSVGPAAIWYTDADGDGAPGSPTAPACEAPPGAVATSTDCLDTDETVHPGALEVCGDGLDNDCDGGPNDCAFVGDLGVDGAQLRLQASLVGPTLAAAGDADGDGLAEVLVGEPKGAGLLTRAEGSPAGGLVDLSTLRARVLGDGASDDCGRALDGLGDLNGDGQLDLVMGCPGATHDGHVASGRAYLVFGPLGSVSTVPDDAYAAWLGGSEEGLGLGAAVAGPGDLDGDGLPEVAAGSPLPNKARGLVLIRAGGSLTEGVEPTLTLTGPDKGADAGAVLAAAGDTDGDGLPELLVGAPRRTDPLAAQSAAVYLVDGSALSVGACDLPCGGLTLTAAGDTEFGAALAGAQDLDHDGYDDILIGAPAADEALWLAGPLVSGRAADLAAGTVRGAAGGRLGAAVALPGDLDQDGLLDLAIGAPALPVSDHSLGAVWLLLGPPSGTLDLADQPRLIGGPTDGLGAALASPGDMNGDGTIDLAVGGAGRDDILIFLGTGL